METKSDKAAEVPTVPTLWLRLMMVRTRKQALMSALTEGAMCIGWSLVGVGGALLMVKGEIFSLMFGDVWPSGETFNDVIVALALFCTVMAVGIMFAQVMWAMILHGAGALAFTIRAFFVPGRKTAK